MSAAGQKLTTGEKLGLTTLLVVGIAGDSMLDTVLRSSWWQLLAAALFTLPVAAFGALILAVRRDERRRELSRTAYLARRDVERVAR